MPTVRQGASGGAINNKFYVAGGFNGANVGAVEVYDPGTGAWTSLAPMPNMRSFAAHDVLNGKLYIAGGRTSGGTPLTTFDVFDPVANTWTNLPPMPTARAYSAMASANGILYVMGGSTDGGTGYTDAVESFNPATGVWSTSAPPMPQIGRAHV